MKRRFTTLAAMLLLTASLAIGILGTASAQEPVHEADGTWHESGPVSFQVTWKGIVRVRWQGWVEVVGEGAKPVHNWEVTATDSESVVTTKETGTAARRHVTFKNRKKLSIGKDYTVVVKALDEEGESLGTRQVAMRPRHISPPEPVTGLTLSAGTDGQSVTARWTAPEAGGMPKRYAVYLTSLDTGRARLKHINVKHGKRGQRALKTDTSFDGLWPGDNYRVSVQTGTRNSRYTRKALSPESWQATGWVSTTIAMPAGADPDYEKVEPDLMWFGYRGGEPADPWVIGEPTQYIVPDANVFGGYRWYDYPNNCNEYLAHDEYFDIMTAGEAVKKARKDAKFWDSSLKARESSLAEKKAKKAKYLEDTPEDQQSAWDIAYFDRQIKYLEQQVEEAKTKLAAKTAELRVKCASKFPVVENLTEADSRFYQVAIVRENEPAER